MILLRIIGIKGLVGSGKIFLVFFGFFLDNFFSTPFTSGDTLPNSNDKILTLTGPPANISTAVDKIAETLRDNFNTNGPYDVKQCGYSGFFGEMATWRGPAGNDGDSGRSAWGEKYMNGRGGGGNLNSNFGFGGGNMGGMGGLFGQKNRGMLDNINPFVQRLHVEKIGPNEAHTYLTHCQSGTVIGPAGRRMNEISQMSGAKVSIDTEDGNNCVRSVKVTGQEGQIKNALWLLEVSINAYCETEFSNCPFGREVSLMEIMHSGTYGMPPLGC